MGFLSLLRTPIRTRLTTTPSISGNICLRTARIPASRPYRTIYLGTNFHSGLECDPALILVGFRRRALRPLALPHLRVRRGPAIRHRSAPNFGRRHRVSPTHAEFACVGGGGEGSAFAFVIIPNERGQLRPTLVLLCHILENRPIPPYDSRPARFALRLTEVTPFVVTKIQVIYCASRLQSAPVRLPGPATLKTPTKQTRNRPDREHGFNALANRHNPDT